MQPLRGLAHPTNHSLHQVNPQALDQPLAVDLDSFLREAVLALVDVGLEGSLDQEQVGGGELGELDRVSGRGLLAGVLEEAAVELLDLAAAVLDVDLELAGVLVLLDPEDL